LKKSCACGKYISERQFYLSRKKEGFYLNTSKKEYEKMANQASPNSPIIKNILWAFFSGGIICTIGQALLNMYKYFGLSKDDASASVSITLIFIGALLTGLKIYDKLAKHAGAGTLVPITGFANSIVSPALEFKSEGFILGMSAKMFTIAGPVLVFGISASIIYGLLLWIFRLY
jgi:stage V sporulation protein AC